MPITIIQIISEEGEYYSRYFNFQVAHRLLVRMACGNIVEVSRYRHFSDGKAIDIAVDLPCMIGCSVRCEFCATGSFKRLLTGEEIAELYKLSMTFDGLSSNDFPVHIASFQGIGEPTLNPKGIGDACYRIRKTCPQVRFSLATTGARLRALDDWMNEGLYFSSMQFSITDAGSHVIKPRLIPVDVLFETLIEKVKTIKAQNSCRHIKLNYLLIKDETDTDECLRWLLGALKTAPVTLKLSCLNSTWTTAMRSFRPALLSRAHHFCDTLRGNGIDAYLYGPFRETKMSCGQLIIENNG